MIMQSMDYSLGEVEALAIKAIRGSGLAWGLAEEGGASLRWLCTHSLPGVSALAAWLQQREWGLGGDPPAGNGSHKQVLLCPIALGCWIGDTAATVTATATIELGCVCQPLLLLPFLAKTDPSREWVLKFNHLRIGCKGDAAYALPPYQDMVIDHSQARIALQPLRLPKQRIAPRVVSPDANAIAVLQTYAQRIYAPATAHSRRAGAGANEDRKP